MSKNASTRDSRFAQLIGLELKAEFARKEISQGDVADKLGHSRSGYSRWLNAKPSMPLEAFLNTCEIIGADPRTIMNAAYGRLIDEMGHPQDREHNAADEANGVLASADNGIDIDAWANRIRAEDALREAAQSVESEREVRDSFPDGGSC